MVVIYNPVDIYSQLMQMIMTNPYQSKEVDNNGLAVQFI